MEFLTRPVKAGELSQLTKFARRTFIETFAPQNTAHDVDLYVSRAFTEAKILGEYNTPGSSFFVTMDGNEITGYLKLNTGEAQTDDDLDDALEIERIYIDQAYKGQGIGRSLMEFSFAKAAEQGLKWIWLGVWEHNLDAIRFYQKNGFETFAKHEFQFGTQAQTDFMMRKAVRQ